MKRTTWMVPLIAALTFSGGLMAQDVFVYPQEGQTQDQQEQDEHACYKWARDNTGFDPMAAPVATAPPPQGGGSGGAGAGGGAVAGAAVGGIVGGSSGAWKGAAVGGVIGGTRRSRKQAQQQQEQQAYAQDQQAQYDAARNDYNRAYATCLQGRAYSVG